VDVLCSNKAGTKFVHVQVKTFVPGAKSVLVGRKASVDRGANFVWVLAGIPRADHPSEAFVYYVIPSPAMAAFAKEEHGRWLATPGRNGRPHQDNSAVAVSLSSATPMPDGTISSYLNKWSHITDLLPEPGRENADDNFIDLDWESESDMKFLANLKLWTTIIDKIPMTVISKQDENHYLMDVENTMSDSEGRNVDGDCEVRDRQTQGSG